MSVTCPSCASSSTEVVSQQSRLPVNSCLLLETEDAAVNFPTGRLDLSVCSDCGFVFNSAFDPSLVEYSGRYEETQACSAYFREFAAELAQHWVDKYDIHDKTIIEIGCGKAEFLDLMCKFGDNKGIGIDPGVDDSRFSDEEKKRMDLRAEFYDGSYGPLEADVVVCRHTLEHIADVERFMRDVRTGIGDRLDTVVLFELPDVARVLEEGAFWDVYYEHCTYFTAGSLARLFRRTGFVVDDVRLEFEGQYIIIEARPAAGAVEQEPLPIEDTPAQVVEQARAYGKHVAGVVGQWKKDISEIREGGGNVAIWGAGSKGVSFLTNVGDGVSIAVDINPRKAGKYMPGTSQDVMVPDDLPEAKPALVVVMNEVYMSEIGAQLNDLGLNPILRAV